MKPLSRKLAFIVVFLASTQVLLARQDKLSDEERKIAEMRKKLTAEQLLSAQINGIKKGAFKPDTTSPLTALQTTLRGTFWRNSDWVRVLALSPEQQKRMDDHFLQYRLKLFDLTASVQKEELILELLFGDTKPSPEDEARILTQIDKIAETRAELEKANSKMLIGILQVLTPDQWSKLPLNQKKTFSPLFMPK